MVQFLSVKCFLGFLQFLLAFSKVHVFFVLLCILAKSLIISFQYNIESVYFFYSNPVYFGRKGPSSGINRNTYNTFRPNYDEDVTLLLQKVQNYE